MTIDEKKSKLNTLPWQAIYDFALTLNIDEDEIKHKEKSYIIQKIIESNSLIDVQISNLVNDYIYGNRITFTLWSFERPLNSTEQKMIIELEGHTEYFLNIQGFRNLHILSVKKHDDRFELLYVYSKEYTYINEHEKHASIWELHRGCVWIGIDKPYIACISKHDKMTTFFIEYLRGKIKLTINQIKPPKSALEKCIKYRAMSKITLQSSTGEKTVISKADGFTENQEEEVKRIKDGRFDTSGSYIAEISDDTCATIKYNMKKGSIGIYKHLSATELFDWTNQAIDIILDEIENLKGRPAEEIFKELGIEIKWNLLCTNKDQALNWFLTQVIASQSYENDFQIQIPNYASNLLYESKLFIKLPRVYCEECESYDIPICAECGNALLLDCYGNFNCLCGSPLKVVCSEGHKSCKQEFWYIPTRALLDAINKNYKSAFQGQEITSCMCITGDVLNISCLDNEKNIESEIPFNKIECFKHEENKDTKQCKEYAVLLKEKCDLTCSYDKIQKCTTEDDLVCLPKIFYGILPGYRPQPHKGTEYGDVSGQIIVDNKHLEMKGIIKKNSANSKKSKNNNISELINKPLLSASKEGEEIIRQFIEQGLIDSRCDVIAIIAPQYIDSGFKGTLRYLARLGNKMVTFIGLDEVSKIVAMNDKINLV